jgi:hypothetical protein
LIEPWERNEGTYEVVQNLVADDARHFEALLAGDRVDDHVAVDADEVFRVEYAVFILDGGESVSRRPVLGWASANAIHSGTHGKEGKQKVKKRMWGNRVGVE